MIPLFAILGLAQRPPITETLLYQLVGLLVVLTVLTMIWLLIQLVGAAFRRAPAPKVTAAGPPGAPPAPPPVPAASAEIPPVIIAVIAAAVHTTVRGPHRIVSIHEEPHREHPSVDVLAWSVEGRRQIFSSHQLR